VTAARPILLLSLVFLLSLAAVTTRIYASDEIEYFSWLRSWTFDRDVDFENEYRYFYDTGAARNPSFHETFLEKTNEAGRRINFAPIGTAMLWAPFYAIGHVVALVTGAPVNGLSAPYIAAVSYGSACYGFLAVLLSAAMARRVIGRGLAAAIAVWIGTPLVYYMYVTPPFSHACSAFAVALFLYVWLRVRDTWTTPGVALLAITGALMAMVREQDLFFVVGPAIDFVRHVTRGTGHSGALRTSHFAPRTIAVGAAAFALAYAPQVLSYYALNGRPRPTELVERKMNWMSPHALEVLFSPEHGLFAWTPLALLAITGLVILTLSRHRFAAPDAPWIGAVALVMIAAQIYVTGAVESWTLAGSFGQRRFIALTPLLTMGMAVMLKTSGVVFSNTREKTTPDVLVSIAVVLCIWWNAGLIVQFGLHRMDRQKLTLRENAWNTFVVLPREAPGIVVRYFTDRSSFYGLPRH
jgi:hypothetical protein